MLTWRSQRSNTIPQVNHSLERLSSKPLGASYSTNAKKLVTDIRLHLQVHTLYFDALLDEPLDGIRLDP